MIDKSLRYNYQWGGPGGKSPGTSASGGSRNGGHDRGGGQHRAAAQRATQAPSPHRDDSAERAAQAVADTLNAARENEARETAREKAIQVAALTTKTPTRSPHKDTQEQIIEQKILDDYGYQDLKAKEPTVPPKRYRDVVVHHPEVDDVVPTEIRDLYSPTGYQDLSRATTGTMGERTWGEQAEAEIPRGGIMSAIGGGLKKIFGDNPLEWALNIASLGGYEKAKYAKALLNLRKKGSISNTAYKKVKSFLDTPKKDAKKLVKGDIRDKDSIATQIAKGTGLESGAELLGLKGIEGQQAKLTKLALAQYRVLQQKANAEQMGQYKMTPQERKYYEDLKKKMMEEKTYSMPIVTVAKGGRIDSPLTGRSRYI